MRFNHYLASHFKSAGCQLIARAYDDCRSRQVELHRMPGEWDVVGVTDGTDAWIAPTAASPFFRTATGDVADIMRRLRAGDPLPPVPEPGAPKRQRRRLDAEPAPEPEPQPRRSRVRL